jgi:hypothetical protein
MSNEENHIIIGELEGLIEFDRRLPLPVMALIRSYKTKQEILRGFFSDADSARAWLKTELQARSKDIRPLL